MNHTRLQLRNIGQIQDGDQERTFSSNSSGNARDTVYEVVIGLVRQRLETVGVK